MHDLCLNATMLPTIGCIETAINIGYSSKLLTDDMTLFIVDKDTDEGVRQQLSEAKEQMEATIARSKSPDPSGVEKNVSFGIVINGHSLV